jgi:hypothetical protein
MFSTHKANAGSCSRCAAGITSRHCYYKALLFALRGLMSRVCSRTSYLFLVPQTPRFLELIGTAPRAWSPRGLIVQPVLFQTSLAFLTGKQQACTTRTDASQQSPHPRHITIGKFEWDAQLQCAVGYPGLVHATSVLSLEVIELISCLY